MHWPSAFQSGDKLRPTSNGKVLTEDIDYLETWKAMEGLMETGKAKAIGISNFSKAEVERLLKEGTIRPAAHQLECHPYLAQHRFNDFHKEKGMLGRSVNGSTDLTITYASMLLSTHRSGTATRSIAKGRRCPN